MDEPNCYAKLSYTKERVSHNMLHTKEAAFIPFHPPLSYDALSPFPLLSVKAHCCTTCTLIEAEAHIKRVRVICVGWKNIVPYRSGQKLEINPLSFLATSASLSGNVVAGTRRIGCDVVIFVAPSFGLCSLPFPRSERVTHNSARGGMEGGPGCLIWSPIVQIVQLCSVFLCPQYIF